MKEMKYKKDRLIEILDKGKINGFKYAIVSYGTHPCCYVFLPKEHKYYKKHYDKINIECHGGLTFSENDLVFNPLPNDEWIIGLDYAHAYDFTGYFIGDDFMEKNCHKWTTEELLEEVKEVIKQL